MYFNILIIFHLLYFKKSWTFFKALEVPIQETKQNTVWFLTEKVVFATSWTDQFHVPHESENKLIHQNSVSPASYQTTVKTKQNKAYT